MPRIELYATTRSDFGEFRTRLDDAFERSVAKSALSKTWIGERLHISGPGCDGTAVFDGGKFTGPVDLWFPATLLQRRICEDIARILREAGCEDVVVR